MGEMADLLMDQMWDEEYDNEPEWEPRNVSHFFMTPYTLVHSTEKAYLVKIFDKNEWFPKSYCELKKDQIVIPAWLAVRKGLPVHMMQLL